MTSTPERRLAIREFLSENRKTTIEELMSEFGVSRRTVFYDLEYLETALEVPLVRNQGNGGGIGVIDRWVSSQRYLTTKEADVLKRVLPGLQPDEQETIKGLLRALENPKTRQKK